MSCSSAVGIDDDLAAGQACISVRSTDDETAGRIDEVLGVLINHILRKDRIKDILSDVFVDLFLADLSIMLCGQYDSLQAYRLSILILHRDLALSIRSEILQSSILANLRQLQAQLVGKVDRERHIVIRLIGGVSEHHSLVAGSDGFDLAVGHLVFLCFQRLVNAHGNIRGLLVQSDKNRAGICIKSHIAADITDLTDGVTHDLLIINICCRSDLTADNNKTSAGSCLTGNTAHGILRNDCVQNRI